MNVIQKKPLWIGKPKAIRTPGVPKIKCPKTLGIFEIILEDWVFLQLFCPDWAFVRFHPYSDLFRNGVWPFTSFVLMGAIGGEIKTVVEV